jgi:hypothetical protein
MRGSNGIHWRNIENDTFRGLARDAAYDSYPDMMDAEREHDGSIDAVFCSASANVRLRDMSGEIRSVFMNGYCGLLAWAIHQRTGLPLAVFTSTEIPFGDWAGHVAIKLGDDEFLDFTGIRTEASIRSEFRGLEDGHKEMGADEFCNLIVDEGYRADPLSLFCDLERFITEDFAEFIITTHKLKALAAV